MGLLMLTMAWAQQNNSPVPGATPSCPSNGCFVNQQTLLGFEASNNCVIDTTCSESPEDAVKNNGDLAYLAKTIYGEARGQNYTSKIAVGWVVKNRLSSGRWGNTYGSVVTSRFQFTEWSQTLDPNGYYAINHPSGSAWSDSMRAAQEVYCNSSTGNPLPGAMWYWSPKAQLLLHNKYPAIYPYPPRWVNQNYLVPNPPGVSNENFLFYYRTN